MESRVPSTTRRTFLGSLGDADVFAPESLSPRISLDAGLLFCAYQYDPRYGFVPIFKKLSVHDALRRFTTHTGSVLVAIPPGVPGPSHYIGEGLFA